MSNNINQNNNTNQRNHDNDRKFDRPRRENPNEFKIPVFLSKDVDKNIHDEIIDVLSNTKFNKISIPVYAYRDLIDDNTENVNKLFNIGYIRKYDAKAKTFTVIIFNKFVDTIKSINEVMIHPVHIDDHKGHLRTITKFTILPVTKMEED